MWQRYTQNCFIRDHSVVVKYVDDQTSSLSDIALHGSLVLVHTSEVGEGDAFD